MPSTRCRLAGPAPANPPLAFAPLRGFPLRLVALSLAGARGTYFSEKPDCPSLPARLAFYRLGLRLIVPDSLPSVKPAVP